MNTIRSGRPIHITRNVEIGINTKLSWLCPNVLPTRSVEYRGAQIRELDLDAALARHPALILVDELAHTNAPGSRHAKRWQDVQELLDAGIDVYTTLNV